MDCYKIIWKSSAEKELRKLPYDVIAQLLKIIENLAMNPYPPNVKKLTAMEHTYRIRYRDYRVVYEVLNNELIVHIIRIGHRGEVYH
jgi:mRNA interferase RelE/StbE